MKQPVSTWLGGLTTLALRPFPSLGWVLALTCFPLQAVENPNALWLEVTGVSNGVISLRLNGTQPFVSYDIQSKSNLFGGWDPELVVAGADGAGWTSFAVNMGARSNALFLRALTYAEPPMDGIPIANLQLWLKANAGVIRNPANNRVNLWLDMSGRGNHASQTSSAQQPLHVEGVVNGRPVVRFNPATFQRMQLPDFLSVNTEGEAFAVVKAATNLPSASRGLWRLGPASTAGYYPATGGAIHEAFGRADTFNTGVPVPRTDVFHLYNVTAGPGVWVCRINGSVHHTTSAFVPGFPATPWIGASGAGGIPTFDGDVAEVMIFDRALTAAERDSVGVHLNAKYRWLTNGPPTPAGLVATALATNQVSLTWTNPLTTAATGYRVERRLGVSGPFILVAELQDATSWIDTDAMGGTLCSYRVKARNHAGESTWSEEATTTTPADGSGLPLQAARLWLRADAGVVRKGSSQRVGLWLDQSGHGNHASQDAVAQQPAHIEGAMNGRPVVHFDPATFQRMKLPDLLASNLQGEVFAVVKAATNLPAANRGLWRLGGATVAGYYPAGSGEIHEGFGRADTLNTGVPAQRTDAFHLYNVSAAPAAWASRLNGTVHYSTGTYTPAFPTALWLGASGASGTPTFDGDVAEMLLFERALTIAERGAVSLYLNEKYQLLELAAEPLELSAQTVSASQIALAWRNGTTANNSLATYTVERRLGSNGTFNAIAQVSGNTHYFHEGLAPGTTYSYRVRHTLVGGADPSNDALGTTLDPGGQVPLSRIVLWLRANDLSSAPGTPVTEWIDFRDPNLKAAQADPLWQPTWVASNFNGLPAVTFGAGTFLQLPQVLSNATSAEAFVVLRSATNTPSVNQGLWRFNDTAPTWFPDTNGAVHDSFGSTAAHENLAPLPDLTEPLIYGASAGADLWQGRMNGPLKQTATSNIVAFAGAPLLGRSAGGASAPFAGQIAELLLFDRALTLEEHKAVRDGLARKYGIALELPAIPAGLSVQITNGTEAMLTWVPLVGSQNGLESRFVVERQVDPTGPFLHLATINRTSSKFHDLAGIAGVSHAYRLRALNDVGDAVSSTLTASPIDTDGDGLPDNLELTLGTDPAVIDSDTDGLPDGWEVRHGLDPRRSDGRHGATGDFDLDGQSNDSEHTLGTDPADGIAGASPLVRLQLHRPHGAN